MSLKPTLERTERFSAFLDREHYRFRRRPGVTPGTDEIAVENGWRIVPPQISTPLTTRMVADFRRFCAEGFEITFCGETAEAPSVAWRLEGEPFPADFDRQDLSVEAFAIVTTREGITITARHERGLLHGTHFLEWSFADRGGPFLKPGTLRRQPAFAPRISNGAMIYGSQNLRVDEWDASRRQYPFGRFSDDYLALMSHYGANGIHIYASCWELFKSETLPELNSPDFERATGLIREFAQRLAPFGIDCYLNLNTHPLYGDHPVFAAHPEVRGALVEIFMEEISGREWYNLCSSSPKTLQAYAEMTRNLFSAVPEVAGASMIIGGECFFHCFTRPANSPNGGTNCPHCRDLNPSRSVAKLVNTVSGALRETGSQKRLYAWPYSAFIWSSADPFQLEWIGHLDPGVSVLCNFDGGDDDAALGAGVRYFDYQIKQIGPSTLFAEQARLLKEKGRPIYAKTETNTTPDFFCLPYIPVHERWLARFEALRGTGVGGIMGQWRFYGMNATPPEELQYKVTWRDPAAEGDDARRELLATIARRDFRLDAEGVSRVLEGWKLISAAWDDYPYSAMTSGERNAYMKGPMYLGPAHPLIFDVQGRYDLPDAFFALRGDLSESSFSEEEMERIRRGAKPRYVSDLLITLPFGVERYLECLGACRRQWEAGLALLREALGSAAPGSRAAMELGVVETVGSILRTLENVVRFYHARDLLQNHPCDAPLFRERIEALQAILSDEIANAEAILPVLERDDRLGYGHSYGVAFSADMVRTKLEQCRFVRDRELPRFSQSIRFHVWLDSP
ncbi:MAG TPA: hypothetical protein VNQ90_01620 [Chthoniobacteraceae bacterium]|nr:hypothetical protein [Chthoniobacteraceae bacterium]